MKSKSAFLIFTILACLNFIYISIQAVNMATATAQADGFDELELIDQPLTPEEIRTLDEGYRQMAIEHHRFLVEDGDLPQTPAEIELEIALDRILGENPARILTLNHPQKYIIIKTSGWMVNPSDITCEQTAEIFHRICMLGLTLRVIGDFVPSRVNPMDSVWTTYLIGNDGRDNPNDIHL